MTRTLDEQKNEIIEQLAERVRERLAADETAIAEPFVRGYYRYVAPEDVISREIGDLYGVALAHLRFGQSRPADKPKVRVYNPRIEQHGFQTTHTVLETVHDDMPFLVDSVGNELTRRGLGIHLVLHPVFQVKRDNGDLAKVERSDSTDQDLVAESFMHFEFDRQGDPAALGAIEQSIHEVLDDVRHAVRDWRAMRSMIDTAIEEMRQAAVELDADEVAEYVAFLEWIRDDHFTLLGYSRYDLSEGGEGLILSRQKGSGLGILRGHDEGLPSSSFQSLSLAARARAMQPFPPVIIAKANTRSTVHRATYLDYVGVKRFDASGKVVGENRFLGLFTSAAYNLSPRFIPVLRRKMDKVVEAARLHRSGHAGKALINILETYPRDELFQTGSERLFEVTRQILFLEGRQQVRLFVRRDDFDRYVTCLVFVPRERYTTQIRMRIHKLLTEAIGSEEIEFQAQLSESPLARIMFLVRTPYGVPENFDPNELERKIGEATHTWTDSLRHALIECEGEEDGNRIFNRFGSSFPVSYQERFLPRAAVPDIVELDRLEQGGPELLLRLYRTLEDRPQALRFKLFRRGDPIHLSDALPILENMGLKVLSEDGPYDVGGSSGQTLWVHDFAMETRADKIVDVDEVRTEFERAFNLVWHGELENDGFNRLVLEAGLSARAVAGLRAYCKYMLQIGRPFSQRYIETSMTANPNLSALLVELFTVRFDPDFRGDREGRMGQLEEALEAGLEQVTSLDEDRIVRLYWGMVKATTRTNAFQMGEDGRPKAYLSLKFDPKRVPNIPLPRPAFEIFVYSPSFEGVHLRGGKVARGGLRWSDRREDFRTEILGLMKAQMVKNAVIVPVGAKGGFVLKNPPPIADRVAFFDEGVRCYKLFLSGLLDITDNRSQDAIIPPQRVIRYDEDDPYLVVAADKGTATFSDYANGVSQSYGFWLDDAFASGGSAGYDHKGMGITARGAWESVKRHFFELGKDCQSEPFTVVGIGDMSGDVFGNGMLLSEQIKLIAAFDHRHIFLDPDPDPASSFAERKRLFEVGRSSWADYDASRISAGGGIFPRTLKSIRPSPEVCKALDIPAAGMTPSELINAILKAPVDLFWNGGIGTYLKASFESHEDAQDRSNDSIRVDATQLRCKIIGEGGNLGCTQLGRIQFAQRGGRVNTDFIDNSAGVDCSDHEVNIKVLFGDIMDAGDMTLKQRDHLLAEMTDEVGELVLRDNVYQNLALSVSEAMGIEHTDAQVRLMRKLEEEGRLHRDIEMLPSDEEIGERRRAAAGLTRPEASVLLCYAKMTLYVDILATDLPDRPYFARDLAKYFPRPIRRRFDEAIARHRLRREIVATWLANSIVNRGQDVFVSELEDQTGESLVNIILSYVVTRDALSLLPIWASIEECGPTIGAKLQTDMLLTWHRTLSNGTRWFLAHAAKPIVIHDSVAAYTSVIARILEVIDDVLSPVHRQEFSARVEHYLEAGVGRPLARAVAGLPYRLAACDIAKVAEDRVDGESAEEIDAAPIACIYFALDAELDVSRIRHRILETQASNRWDRLALTGLEDGLADTLRRMTAAALDGGIGADNADEAARMIGEWLQRSIHGIGRYRMLLREFNEMETPDLSAISVAVNALGDLSPVSR